MRTLRGWPVVLLLLAALAPARAQNGHRDGTEVAGRYLRVHLDRDRRAPRPGATISLYADVTPGPKIHVYAPGQPDYIPVELTLTSPPDLKAAAPVFPKPLDFYFEPLHETVKVYDRQFRIAQDVTIADTAALRRRAAARETLAVAATLTYQACDDAVCYRPETLTLTWRLPLQR